MACNSTSMHSTSSIKPDDARKTKTAQFRQENFKKFQELWKRINQRTFYQVDFDTDDLVKKAIKELDEKLKVTEIRIVVEGGSLEQVSDKESLEAGLAMKQGNTRTIHVTEAVGKGVATNYKALYDMVTK